MTDMELRFGLCHGPGCDKQAANHFCSEDCWRTWHRKWNAGDQTPAEYVLEWRHPYKGGIREAVCVRHYEQVRGALRALGIGHAGAWADGDVCVRCVHDDKDTRDWIGSAVVPELSGEVMSR